jgi:subtilisin family serine protease
MAAARLLVLLALALGAAATRTTVYTNPVGRPTPRHVLRALEAAGATVERTSRHGALTVDLPRAQHKALSAIEGVRSVRPMLAPQLRSAVGTVNARAVANAADAALDGPYLRSHYGTDGSGVKVGVISDSASQSSINALRASGDLPSGITVLAHGSGTNEGTAMMVLVHKIAPGAALYFHTCGNTEAAMGDAIAALVAAGCDIVVDDIGWAAEPALHLSSPIMAEIEAARAAGVLYVTAAGNDGALAAETSATWEGVFQYDENELQAVFGGQAGLRLTGGDTPIAITLWWSDPLGASGNDYDLLLYDETMGMDLVAVSDFYQNGTQDPFEIIYGLAELDTGHNYSVHVYKYVDEETEEVPADRYLRIQLFGCTTFCGLSPATAGAVYGHAGHPGALAVGAVDVTECAGGCASNEPVAQVYSSDGPRRVFFNSDGVTALVGNLAGNGLALPKPDFASLDGVATAAPGFSTFYGTSAAAPHLAALAALVLGALPPGAATPDALTAFLAHTTVGVDPGTQGGEGIPWLRTPMALLCGPGAYLDVDSFDCANCTGGETGGLGEDSCAAHASSAAGAMRADAVRSSVMVAAAWTAVAFVMSIVL